MNIALSQTYFYAIPSIPVSGQRRGRAVAPLRQRGVRERRRRPEGQLLGRQPAQAGGHVPDGGEGPLRAHVKDCGPPGEKEIEIMFLKKVCDVLLVRLSRLQTEYVDTI